MLNQSFSAENFRRIFDLENRKGVFLEGKYFPQLKDITEKIKDCNKNIKREKKEKVSNGNDELKKLYEERKLLKKEKERQLNKELQNISENIVAKEFRIEMIKKDIANSKSLYLAKDTPENYFAIKQLQINFSRSFIVKQSNRSQIISQVKILLDDKLPKFILRTDIDDFYENIPHERLFHLISNNHILSPFSRKLLGQILHKYRELSGNSKGIPRGVGISANLAELYMRDIDSKIVSLFGLIYYARYVDDIIIIFAPTLDSPSRKYLDDIKNIVEFNNELKLNATKTKSFDLINTKGSYELEYLGYKISFGNGHTKTRLTNKKMQKYRGRLDATFKSYSILSRINEKEARKYLVKRLRYLTGNTRLKGNKKNILIGIYYSNSQLTEKNDLFDLDKYLENKIKNEIKIFQLQQRLRKYSFMDGFNNKHFSPFKTEELKEILKSWD